MVFQMHQNPSHFPKLPTEANRTIKQRTS